MNNPYLRCGAHARIRYNSILECIHFDNITVLDVGCGIGQLGKIIESKKNASVVFLDIKLGHLKRIKNGKRVCADGAMLPFKDYSFDYVVSSDALEHIPLSARRLFINEMIRVTRKSLLLTFSTVSAYTYGGQVFRKWLNHLHISHPNSYREHSEFPTSVDEIEHLLIKRDINVIFTKSYQGIISLSLWILGMKLGKLEKWSKKRKHSPTLVLRISGFLVNSIGYLLLKAFDFPPHFSFFIYASKK